MFEWVLNTPCRSYIILRTLSFSKWSFWVGICSPVFWLFLICNFRGCIWNRNAVFDWFVLGYGFILKHNSLRNLLVDGHFHSIPLLSDVDFVAFFPVYFALSRLLHLIMYISSKQFVDWNNLNTFVKYSLFQWLWDSADESDILYKGYAYKEILSTEIDT